MNSYISDWKAPLVAEEVRRRSSRCYAPLLLSIGPIFHGQPSLKDMEDLKPEIFRNFIQECATFAPRDVDIYEKKLFDVCCHIKSCYSEEIRKRYTDRQFYEMFLVDVCFLVVVIHCIVSKNERKLPLSSSVLRMCLRDLFLLENQIPFIVVEDLVRLRFGRQGMRNIINQFLSAVIHHSLGAGDMYHQPIHLLDLLRQKYIGKGRSGVESADTYCSTFFSAKKLHGRGIRFWAAASPKIGYSIVHMEFDGSRGNLYMPPVLINESFESIFLNIAAYEASQNDPQKSEVTTYLCLMQRLAQDSESVCTLRQHVILSKEDNSFIAQMFQRMGEILHPNYEIYDHLLLELQNFPSGYTASIMRWFRKPSTTHLISLLFITTAVMGIMIALADILSFSSNSNKVMRINK